MFDYMLTYDFMHKVGSALHTLLSVLWAAALSQKSFPASRTASAQHGSASGFCCNSPPCSHKKGTYLPYYASFVLLACFKAKKNTQCLDIDFWFLFVVVFCFGFFFPHEH